MDSSAVALALHLQVDSFQPVCVELKLEYLAAFGHLNRVPG